MIYIYNYKTICDIKLSYNTIWYTILLYIILNCIISYGNIYDTILHYVISNNILYHMKQYLIKFYHKIQFYISLYQRYFTLLNT